MESINGRFFDRTVLFFDLAKLNKINNTVRELSEVIVKSFSIIYQCSRSIGAVSEDWRLASVLSIYKKHCEEDQGNFRSISLTLVPRS